MKSSTLQISAKGDIFCAKSSPFIFSSYDIVFPLDDLARNIAIDLKCCCKASSSSSAADAEDEDVSLAVKKSFNPQKIFLFVLEKAVCPQVVEEEIEAVVRVSTALNAFRHGFVVRNTSEVDESFCAEKVLDFLKDMAVNLCADDRAEAQLYAFRRFSSVKPDWFYQLDWEFEAEEDGLENHEIEVDLELPDCTSEDELYHGRTRDPELDILIRLHEESESRDVNHKHEGSEMCVINMVDLSIFDSDDIFESLIYDQCQMDVDGDTSHERTVPSCTEGALAMTEVDANETAANVIDITNSEFVMSSPRNDSNHIVQAADEVTFDRSTMPNLENATGERNSTMPSSSDKCNSVEVVSSKENLSPCTEGASSMTEVDADETAANVIDITNSEFVMSSPRNDSNHIVQAADEANFNRSTMPNLENATGERNSTMTTSSDNCNSAEILSSEENLSPCTEGASTMTKVDAYETAANVIDIANSEFVISSPRNYPYHIVSVANEATFNRSTTPNLENATGERNSTVPASSDKCNSVEVLTSAESLPLRTLPFYTGQLHNLPMNKCSIDYPLKVLNPSIKPQSRLEACINISNGGLIPEMTPFAETALQISSNKRKLYELTNDGSDAIKPHFSSQSHFSNYPGHVSKPCYRKRQQNHLLQSKCKAFRASPLTSSAPNSTNRRLKSLDCNNSGNSSAPVLLIMKFPKNYLLPSKEKLEEMFGVFGPLDRTRTKLFFYTGVGQVVFLHQAGAVLAFNYVKRKRIFGQVYVRFWFYRCESCRNGSSNVAWKSC